MSTPPSFAAFFEAVWGYTPFPWQKTLAERVVSEGWPHVLDLPTSSGKTAAIDVALYHLAVDGGLAASRKIVLVVDRRVIVEQVGVRVRTLQRALDRRGSEPTRWVADALARMVGDGSGTGDHAPLLETAVLRGATLREEAWAHRPHVPVIAASTVDQVGSRLFFRGYGVSDGMKPIHAGLLGCDTLLLLDEVHLARPFAEVLAQLDRIRGLSGDVPRRFSVVQLSATPGPSSSTPFRLTDEDRAHPVLAKRLGASKPAVLDVVKVRMRDADAVKREAVAQRAAIHARELVGEGRRAVAIVVNRVDTARRVWTHLRGDAFDCELVTGRMRPLDQQDVLGRIGDRVLAGRPAASDGKPLVLVATQCIEAGADFDFDSLVTECPSLDALRQRFGRVDRFGHRPSRAVILGRSDLAASADDPVYGQGLAKTWQWLQTVAERGSLDLGIDALEPHLRELGDALSELCASTRPAPVLMPAYLDQWVQTSQRPNADPDVSLFLHGIPDDARQTVSDVQVVWRADISEADLEQAHRDRDASALVERLGVAPPGSLEALSIPIWTVKRWLVADTDAPPADDDIADVDGQRQPDLGAGSDSMGQRVLLWQGRRNSVVVTADSPEVRPGSLLVVPATRGGLGPHGTFDPESRHGDDEPAVVRDLGDGVQLLQRGRPTLRLDDDVVGWWLGSSLAPLLPDHGDDEVDAVETARDALAVAVTHAVEEQPTWLRAIREQLAQQAPRLVRLEGADGGARWAAVGRPVTVSRLRELLGRKAAGAVLVPPADATTEGDDGSFTGARSTLEDHLSGVGGLAEWFATAAGLPPGIVASLRWAGCIHDVGKIDRRFQLWLHGGDEVSAAVGPALAKSGLPHQDAAARRRARERAGYPRGQRHELVSLDMAEGSEDLESRVRGDGGDWQLVLHLVASHHGWCRPFAPAVAVDDAEAEPVTWALADVELSGTTAHGRARLDRGVADRFWALVRQYGWHELAYLEAVLRLADHRRSALEQQGGS